MNIKSLRQSVQYPSSCYGECDGCHREAALWIDHSEPGEFGYCKWCIQQTAKTVKHVQVGQRQRKLLDGLDCCPGQNDLFDAEGGAA